MTRQTCRTCNAVQEAEGAGAEDYGFCHAKPPEMIGDNPHTSYFPPVHLDKTWCRQWAPKDEAKQ